MCADPATIATLISSTVSGLTSGLDGVASSRAARYNAQVSENNAVIARQRAEQARDAGERDIVRSQYRTGAAASRAALLAAAGGVETASGSPLAVLAGIAERGADEVAVVRFNAEQRARDLEFEAENFESQAFLQRAQAGGPLQNALRGYGTYLSGVSRAAGMFGSAAAGGG